jgi:ABC-type uncharacterized transport system fused permease/ATPase subunit
MSNYHTNATASISSEDSIATLRASLERVSTLRASVSAPVAEAFPQAAVSQATHCTDVSW